MKKNFQEYSTKKGSVQKNRNLITEDARKLPNKDYNDNQKYNSIQSKK